MSYRLLYVLCEGNDDERFFEHVAKPQLQAHYDSITYYQYAQETPKKVRRLVDSILAIPADYIYLRDFDEGACITSRKEDVLSKYDRLDEEHIAIVVQMIESWYAAGASEDMAPAMSQRQQTNNLRKQDFDQQIPAGYASRIDFMREVLKQYDLSAARTKNDSLDYFCTTFL